MAEKNVKINLEIGSSPGKAGLQAVNNIFGNAMRAAGIAGQALGGNVLGALRGAGGMAGGAIGSIFGPAGSQIGSMIGEKLGGLPEMAMNLAKSMSTLVEAFSPQTSMEFNRVLKDMTATMGMVLQPVVQHFTKGLRNIADIMLGFAVKLRPVIEAAVKLADAQIALMMKVYAAMGIPMKNSFGLGGFQVGFTSGEGLHRQSIQAFMEAANQPTADPQERAAGYLETISRKLEEWDAFVRNWKPFELPPGWR